MDPMVVKGRFTYKKYHKKSTIDEGKYTHTIDLWYGMGDRIFVWDYHTIIRPFIGGKNIEAIFIVISYEKRIINFPQVDLGCLSLRISD